MENKLKRKNAITLIALVITIIILLILAGISIGQLIGNGLFEKAKIAKEVSKNAQEDENDKIAKYTNEINSFTRSNGKIEKILLYPDVKKYEPANSLSTEYNLNDRYDNYEYLLVECNHNNGNSWYVGTATATIVTEDIIQAESFLINNTVHPNTSYSIWCAGGDIAWYFNSYTTFKIGVKNNVEITKIYGIK